MIWKLQAFPQHFNIAIIADVIIGSASIANLELLDYAALNDRSS